MKGRLRFPVVQSGWSAACEPPDRGDTEFSQNCFPFAKAWRDRTGASTHGGGILLAWRIAYTTSVHLLPAHKNPVPIFPAHQEGQRVTTEYPAHQFPDAGKGGISRGVGGGEPG